MHFVVLTGHCNILSQSVLDIAIQAFDVEVHVVLVEVFEHLVLRFDIGVDSEEGRDLIFLDVHQILIGQVLKQNVTPISSMIRQTIQDALLPLHHLRLVYGLPVRFLLILDKLIVAILFIVLVVLPRMAIY